MKSYRCLMFVFTFLVGNSDQLEKEVYRGKHVSFCELSKTVDALGDADVNGSCDLNYFNFTFYTHFRLKRAVKYRTLGEPFLPFESI